MTKQDYRRSVRLSHSRRARLARPFPDHFSACQPPGTSGEHPIDLLIDRLPEVASRRRKLVRLVKRWQHQARDQRAFIAYEDTRVEYFTLREQLYFNAGFERGLLAGRAESRQADVATLAFAHQLGLTVATAKLPKPHITAALLGVARSVLLGLPLR